jgi:ABC-type phosphate transport system substrate-binding protein
MHARIRQLAGSVLAAFIALRGGTLSAGDAIAVIVAKDAPDMAINRVLLRNIYLKKIFVDDDGHPYIPVNLPPENPLRVRLAESLFNKSAQQLQDYWNQRYFQGVPPPYVLSSQEAVMQFVAKTPGAIGYVAACRLDERVRSILEIPLPPSGRDAAAGLCPPAGGADQPD